MVAEWVRGTKAATQRAVAVLEAARGIQTGARLTGCATDWLTVGNWLLELRLDLAQKAFNEVKVSGNGRTVID